MNNTLYYLQYTSAWFSAAAYPRPSVGAGLHPSPICIRMISRWRNRERNRDVVQVGSVFSINLKNWL